MQTYINKNYTKRNYERTNVICCVADKPPRHYYIPCDASELDKLTHLYTQNDVKYYGYL